MKVSWKTPGDLNPGTSRQLRDQQSESGTQSRSLGSKVPSRNRVYPAEPRPSQDQRCSGGFIGLPDFEHMAAPPGMPPGYRGSAYHMRKMYARGRLPWVPNPRLSAKFRANQGGPDSLAAPGAYILARWQFTANSCLRWAALRLCTIDESARNASRW